VHSTKLVEQMCKTPVDIFAAISGVVALV